MVAQSTLWAEEGLPRCPEATSRTVAAGLSSHGHFPGSQEATWQASVITT